MARLDTYEKTITVADVALDIGEGLARAALAGKINNCLVDLNYEINNDSDLEIITSKNIGRFGDFKTF